MLLSPTPDRFWVLISGCYRITLVIYYSAYSIVYIALEWLFLDFEGALQHVLLGTSKFLHPLVSSNSGHSSTQSRRSLHIRAMT